MTEKIDELFFELYTRLEPDDVIAYLRKHMSPSIYQKIDNDRLTNLEKSKELLNWLTKKPNVYPDFLKALKISKQEDLYNLLEGEHTRNERSSERNVVPPDTGNIAGQSMVTHPTDDDIIQEMRHDVDESDGFLSNKTLPTSKRMVNDSGSFDMSSKPRGLALLINNVDFDMNRRRNGSDVDAANIAWLFKALGYEFFSECRNLSYKQMNTTIQDFRRDRRHAQYSSCVVIILSHGSQGVVFATDSNIHASQNDQKVIYIDTLLHLFTGSNCPSLNGKPKMFFIQACRGDKMDSGSRYYSADSPDAARARGDIPDDNRISQDYDDTDGLIASTNLPSQIDFYVAYATVPGYVSWRNSEKGSWFIQSIARVFRDYAAEEHLEDMMLRVRRIIASEFKSSSGGYKMTPESVSHLSKKIYFNPGL